MHAQVLLAAVKAHAGEYNLAPLTKVRATLARDNWTRTVQDAFIRQAIREGKLSPVALEGREGITEEESAASIVGGAGERIGFLMMRGTR